MSTISTKRHTSPQVNWNMQLGANKRRTFSFNPIETKKLRQSISDLAKAMNTSGSEKDALLHLIVVRRRIEKILSERGQ